MAVDGSSTSRTPTRVSNAFPHAESFDPDALPGSGLGRDAINYIRNSVKITMDAYDGTMHFYVADPTDPIIRAYEGVFPELFESLDAMPAQLHDHLRVPEELFNVQTRDVRRLPRDRSAAVLPDGRPVDRAPEAPGDTSTQTLPSEAYYVVMRMPGRGEVRVPPAPADGPAQATEHDRLGRRPE